MSEKIKLPILVGPTASGKSALALRIAAECNCEIVSCDSMQIYQKMNIGTAKPTAAEMSQIRHYLVDFLDPSENFSCADYAVLARKAIEEIMERGKTPLIVGGTGLYLDALLRGGLAQEADSDEGYREELRLLALEKGSEHVHGLLREVDPESAAAIHPNNLKRVIRALEIYRVCGIPKSELDKQNASVNGVYEPLAAGLFYTDRQALYDRIDKRVDVMLEEGLLGEVETLMNEGLFERSVTAAGAIGYKELLGYLRGACTLEEAVEELKRSTRRYAKRQLTWFGAKEYIQRVEVETPITDEGLEKIVKKLKKVFQFC